jgi:magnesium-transporting ATPase (P-type)
VKATNPLRSHSAQRAIISLLCCLAGGYFMGLFSAYIPTDKPVMPITLFGLLLIPITITTNLIFKLNDTKKLKGLNRDEKRRLEPIVDIKIFRLYVLIAIYLISAATIAILFFGSSLPSAAPYLKYILIATGVCLAFALCNSIFSIADTKRTSDFEAKITNRSIERKAKTALLKRLQTKTPDQNN